LALLAALLVLAALSMVQLVPQGELHDGGNTGVHMPKPPPPHTVQKKEWTPDSVEATNTKPSRPSDKVVTKNGKLVDKLGGGNKNIAGNGNKKNNRPPEIQFDYHFVHIPKCGGTSMTAILRQIACRKDPIRNEDCCTNPGFCDHNAKRRCKAIKGCINHFPQKKFLNRPMPSITIMREPLSRLLSAFFYRGHSPNLDFFKVRPEFKLIKEGKAPKVKFPEYIEMNEYQNIQTRMLGADSFPYRNVDITAKVYESAVEALNKFFFVGLQEQYELSVELLAAELNLGYTIPVKNERENSKGGRVSKNKQVIKNNKLLMDRAAQTNSYDVQLYALAIKKFCDTLAKHTDLLAKLDRKKVVCPQ
jgi:hypothetical protein